MRKVKNVLMAAIVAASTLTVGVTPSHAAAEVSVATQAAVVLPDGTYTITDKGGNVVGFMVVSDGGRTITVYEVQRETVSAI